MSKTTTERNPLYAVAGAADLAVETLRQLPARLPGLAHRAENAAVSTRAKITDRLVDLPGEAQKLRNELPAEMQKLRNELPADVEKLRSELPGFLQDAQAKAQKYYAELAIRGEGAVARLRREQASAIESVAVKVADTAEKAADAADKAADDIADTAEKAADATDKAADNVAGSARARSQSAAKKPRKTTKAAPKSSN